MPTTPTGTSRGAMRAAGQAKASTARTITVGSAIDTITIWRQGGCAAKGLFTGVASITE